MSNFLAMVAFSGQTSAVESPLSLREHAYASGEPDIRVRELDIAVEKHGRGAQPFVISDSRRTSALRPRRFALSHGKGEFRGQMRWVHTSSRPQIGLS